MTAGTSCATVWVLKMYLIKMYFKQERFSQLFSPWLLRTLATGTTYKVYWYSIYYNVVNFFFVKNGYFQFDNVNFALDVEYRSEVEGEVVSFKNIIAVVSRLSRV